MTAKAFVDTNILVYAHDPGSGRKHEIARALIEELWSSRLGVVSTQVMQEFYVNVRRKAQRPISVEQARALIENYFSWTVVVNDQSSILGAIDLETRYQLSFWDALIVQAANAAAVEVLYSEDLSHGQRYGSVELVNPFAGSIEPPEPTQRLPSESR